MSELPEGQTLPLDLKPPRPKRPPRPGSKRYGVLVELLERGSRGLNRFEAEEWPTADHCLPSTISELARDFGLRIPRSLEVVPGFRGKRTEVARYRLDSDDRVKVLALLGGTPEAEHERRL